MKHTQKYQISRPFFGRLGADIDNRYHIDRVLGHGPYGTVYKVFRHGENTPYALKVVSLWDAPADRGERLLKRFDMDYQSAEIRHDNLINTHDKGLVNGNPYIVEDYCHRGNVNELIGTPEFDINVTALQILFGLKALHSRGKVHGDLKPCNVLIGDDGRAVLSDFGVVGSCNRSLANRGLDRIDAERFSTYAYMAPETLMGNDAMMAVFPTADIYSFGVTMYELLTGYMPFGHLSEADELAEYLEKALHGDWDRRKLSYSPNLRCWLPVIEACLSSDPARRVQNVDDLLQLIPIQQESKTIAETTLLENETPTGYCLRVIQGEQFGQVFYLDRMIGQSGRRVISIGRYNTEAPNFVSILERRSCFVSRRQCTLEQDPQTGEWLLRDGQWDVQAPGRWRSSRNGTLLGDKKVGIDGEKVKIGDVITIGDVKLRLEGY